MSSGVCVWGGDGRDIHLERGVGKEVWDVEQLREDVKGENKIWTVKKKERIIDYSTSPERIKSISLMIA